MSATFKPERLICIRETLGINKAEAARRLDLSKMGYGRYENGQRTPSPQMVEYMAQRLGTTVAFLTGTSDDPAPDQFIITTAEPELFELITRLRGRTTDDIQRLTYYLEQLEK